MAVGFVIALAIVVAARSVQVGAWAAAPVVLEDPVDSYQESAQCDLRIMNHCLSMDTTTHVDPDTKTRAQRLPTAPDSMRRSKGNKRVGLGGRKEHN